MDKPKRYKEIPVQHTYIKDGLFVDVYVADEMDAYIADMIKQLEELTPQGSEFYQDFDTCLAWIKSRLDRQRTLKKIIVRLKKEATEREAYYSDLARRVKPYMTHFGNCGVGSWDTENFKKCKCGLFQLIAELESLIPERLAEGEEK